MDRNFFKIILLISFVGLVACSDKYSNSTHANKIDYKKAALLNVELGRNYLSNGYTERAKKKFVHALELKPDLAEAHSGMGYFWEVVKEYKEAESHYRKSIMLGNGKGIFYNQYAVFLCERGRYKEANKNFVLAINDKFYDQTSEVYNNAALCALKHSDLKKAEQYFIKSLHHDPQKIHILLDLAKVALSQQEFNASEDYLKQFYVVNNNKPTAEYLLLSVKVAKALGQDDLAASKLLVLKNLFPNSVEYSECRNE
jgi:type IV pilus assembly protein PilF